MKNMNFGDFIYFGLKKRKTATFLQIFILGEFG